MSGYRAHSTAGGIAIEGPDEDAAYENFRQRELDEANDVQRALFAGREAGRSGTASGANLYPIGTPEYAAWERGRSTEEAQSLARELSRRPRLSCQPCTCGGRGLCLADAA